MDRRLARRLAAPEGSFGGSRGVVRRLQVHHGLGVGEGRPRAHSARESKLPEAIAEELATTKLEKRRSELEMDAVKVKRAFLVEEYKAFCRTDEPILQSKFCDLVVRAILKRVQDACGLECKMKESIDGDEITMGKISAGKVCIVVNVAHK